MKILGVNTGNGAVLYPFKDHLVGAIENRTIYKTPNNIQWELNYPDTPLYGRIWDFTKTVDAIIGHPDCGNSSVLAYSRAKKLSDPKNNDSVIMFHAALKKYRPKFFLFENLPKFLDNFTEEELKVYFCNYRLVIIKDSVTIFGNSQVNRKRLIIVGCRDKGFKKYFPKPNNQEICSVGALYEQKLLICNQEKPHLCHVHEDLNEMITMYGGYKVSAQHIREKWVTEYKDQSRWPALNRKYSTAPGVYKNLIYKPPNTVRKGNREFNHKGLMMSPRERAIIQGYPNSFKIWYDSSKKKTCINKGRVTVTKCFPYEVSIWFLACLKKALNEY